MYFDKIQTVLDADSYVRLALKAAREAIAKKKKTHGRKDYVLIEAERLRILADYFSRRMKSVLTSFPSIDALPVFYRELVHATLDYGMLKKSLGAVNWLCVSAERLEKEYQKKVRRSVDGRQARQHIGAFIGRLSSVTRQVRENLEYLEKCRAVMRSYPVVKDCFTVALTGFPNVGKSTLLSRLTDSKPEIAPYPFTTKSLNMGYMEHRHQKIQIIDTPGTLDRLERMNQLEKQAYIAIRHLADIVVFVIDPFFPEESQAKLLSKTRESRKEVLVYVSKADIAEKEAAQRAQKYSGVTDPEELRRMIAAKAFSTLSRVSYR